MIKLNVSAANIAVEEKETLTEGRVGLLCQFHFSPDWDGLVKTAVFDGADSRDVILMSDTVSIPAECLSTEGYSLSVGVYGKNAAGDIVIPTVYATVGKIQRSAYPSGREPAAPTPDVVAQIQQAAANAEKLARSVRESGAGLVEWRVDAYRGGDVTGALEALRQELGEEMPILFTFRTREEGGLAGISGEEYARLYRAAAGCGWADLFDLEVNRGEAVVRPLLRQVQALGGKGVLSFHDFEKTPGEETLLTLFRRMEQWGADIAKIAVMPRDNRDVTTLLSAAARYSGESPQLPLIAISMGQRGMVSRLCGEITGSCLTFGTWGAASAPGQPSVDELRAALRLLHGGEG